MEKFHPPTKLLPYWKTNWDTTTTFTSISKKVSMIYGISFKGKLYSESSITQAWKGICFNYDAKRRFSFERKAGDRAPNLPIAKLHRLKFHCLYPLYSTLFEITIFTQPSLKHHPPDDFRPRSIIPTLDIKYLEHILLYGPLPLLKTPPSWISLWSVIIRVKTSKVRIVLVGKRWEGWGL